MPVIADGRSSTAAKRIMANAPEFNLFPLEFTPVPCKAVDVTDAASDATTVVASALEARDLETTAIYEHITAATFPADVVPVVNSRSTAPFDATTDFDISASPAIVPTPPFDMDLHAPNVTRLRRAPWYFPLCTLECRTCQEDTVGGITPCQIRLHTPKRPVGVAWNKTFQKNNAESKYVNENRDYMLWWTKIHRMRLLPRTKGKTKTGPTALKDEETERIARLNARMAVLLHKELVYLRSMAVGNGEYYSLVLKDPEWYPGVKCPIDMELWDEHKFNRYTRGESEHEMMEDIMIQRMILRDRRRKGCPELTIKEIDEVHHRLQELRDMLTAELNWEERRNEDWWQSEPFHERRRLSQARCEDRPIDKVDGRYIFVHEEATIAQ